MLLIAKLAKKKSAGALMQRAVSMQLQEARLEVAQLHVGRHCKHELLAGQTVR